MSIHPPGDGAGRLGPEVLRLQERDLEDRATRYAESHPEAGYKLPAGPIRRALKRVRLAITGRH